MGHPVTIRQTKSLEASMRNGQVPEIPSDCINNRIIIHTLLTNFGAKVYPPFSNLTDSEVLAISNCTAYLMRPDRLNIHTYNERIHSTIMSKEGQRVNLKEDPSVFSPDFILEGKAPDLLVAPEIYRCYVPSFGWLPLDTQSKLGPEGYSAISLTMTDMTAHLLYKDDLQDYIYTESELKDYEERVIRQISNR